MSSNQLAVTLLWTSEYFLRLHGRSFVVDGHVMCECSCEFCFNWKEFGCDNVVVRVWFFVEWKLGFLVWILRQAAGRHEPSGRLGRHEPMTSWWIRPRWSASGFFCPGSYPRSFVRFFSILGFFRIAITWSRVSFLWWQGPPFGWKYHRSVQILGFVDRHSAMSWKSVLWIRV